MLMIKMLMTKMIIIKMVKWDCLTKVCCEMWQIFYCEIVAKIMCNMIDGLIYDYVENRVKNVGNEARNVEN